MVVSLLNSFSIDLRAYNSLVVSKRMFFLYSVVVLGGPCLRKDDLGCFDGVQNFLSAIAVYLPYAIAKNYVGRSLKGVESCMISLFKKFQHYL